ncbi:hypothetical protein BGLY_0471 [Bacillus glycinifermentans]|nr:hypothetical protein BGLY_0471 [Bacillus glycinifermentans]
MSTSDYQEAVSRSKSEKLPDKGRGRMLLDCGYLHIPAFFLYERRRPQVTPPLFLCGKGFRRRKHVIGKPGLLVFEHAPMKIVFYEKARLHLKIGHRYS